MFATDFTIRATDFLTSLHFKVASCRINFLIPFIIYIFAINCKYYTR